ncbi:MAG: flippase-like domain-containing protein [Spirochaetota bacterium]|nr:flippase-like domain-containing protein [Spirochaetota bacterium]
MKNQLSKYRRGIFVFIAISLIALFILFITSEMSFTTLKDSLKKFDNLICIPLAILFLLIHIVTDGLRLKLLASGMKDKLSLKESIKAGLANEFLSAITPFQSGGQPLEIYVIHKAGISLGKSVVISYFKTATNLFFLFTTGFFALLYYSSLTTLTYLNLFYVYGGLFITYFSIISYLSVFKPNFAKKLSYNILRFLRKIKIIKRNVFLSKVKFILREAKIFNHNIREYFFNRKGIIILVILITFVVWSSKYLIAYFIALGLNINISIMEILFYQSAIHFVNYSIPTPGASGTSEFVAYSIFKFLSFTGFNSTSGLASLNIYVVLWRFFTYHFIVILSGIVTFKILKDRVKESKKITEELIQESES